jgi:hypothetical protein
MEGGDEQKSTWSEFPEQGKSSAASKIFLTTTQQRGYLGEAVLDRADPY